jgi:hypothetical protein
VLIGVACLLIAAADLAVWLRTVVLDTDRFVDTLEPLAVDEDVLDALTASLTEQIMAVFTPDRNVTDALPDELVDVATDLGEQARAFVEEAVGDALHADEFAGVWSAALERAHRDGLDVVRDPDGTFALRFTEAVERADNAFEEMGVDLVDDATLARARDVVVLQSGQLGETRRAVEWLDRLGPVLPPAAIAAAVAALVLAPDRRRAVVGLGVGAAVARAGAWGGVRWERRRALADATPGADRRAAADTWDTLAAPLARQTVLLAVAALAIAAAAAYLGRRPAGAAGGAAGRT